MENRWRTGGNSRLGIKGELSKEAIWVIDKWKEGWSAGQIAYQLAKEFPGFHKTRNAIIGLVSREGLTRGVRPPGKGPARIRTAKIKDKGIKNLSRDHWRPRKSITRRDRLEAKKQDQQVRSLPEMVSSEEAREEARTFSPLRVDLLIIRDSQCHFPVGPEKTTYCGRDNYLGYPYCIHHCQLMYQSVKNRQQRRAA